MAHPIAVVTGAAGFIGSHMTGLLLDRGYRVHGIDNLVGGRVKNLDDYTANPNLVFEVRDVRDLKPGDALFRDARYVFHFAGVGDIVPSIDRPVEYMSANVMGTVCVLEAARHAGVAKLVYAASSSCFGSTCETPTPETAPIKPEYPYALSKYMGEQAVLHWGKLYRLPVMSVRIFNAYGPRSATRGAYGAVFGVFLAQKLAGKPFTLVGDGTQSRDFVFVADVVRAFLLAAESPLTQQVYNLGTGRPQTVNRLIELLGGDVVRVPKRPGEPDSTWAEITKIQTELGWAPTVSFEEGVAEMLRNLEYWREARVWEPESIRAATEGWFAALSGEQT